MPASSLVPRNGAVAVGSLLADFVSFEIQVGQTVGGATPYGPGTCARNVGSGTADFTIHVAAFALARAAGTAPGLPALSSGGQTCTFTLDTGVTESGACVLRNLRLSHSRIRAAVPVAFTLRCAGEITETWATD